MTSIASKLLDEIGIYGWLESETKRHQHKKCIDYPRELNRKLRMPIHTFLPTQSYVSIFSMTVALNM